RSISVRSRRSAWPRRNTQRARGTPRRRAAATDMSSTAAPWLTFSRATMYRVYGSAMGRFAQPVAPVFQAALGVLGEVGLVVGAGVMLDGRDGLRAEQQHDLAAPARDRRRELVDQVLRCLPAADLQ